MRGSRAAALRTLKLDRAVGPPDEGYGTSKHNLGLQVCSNVIDVGRGNQYIDTLGLQMERPVTVSRIFGTSTISPPGLAGFSGSIVTRTYFFGFTEGRLRYVHRTEEASRVGNSISAGVAGDCATGCSTNQAYRLGVKLLANLGVDVTALEKMHPPSMAVRETTTNQGENKSRSDGLAAPSVVEVTWGRIQVHPRRKYTVPAVTMALSAADCQVVRLRIEGPSEYWKRPPVLLPGTDELQALKDERFAKMTAMERKVLFEKHSRMPYPINLTPHVAHELQRASGETTDTGTGKPLEGLAPGKNEQVPHTANKNKRGE